jgi:hypothetical protein
LGKQIPLIGLAIGVGYGVFRIIKGEPIKAAMEFGSGVASCFPGIGTGVSIAIDSCIVAHDIKQMSTKKNM